VSENTRTAGLIKVGLQGKLYLGIGSQKGLGACEGLLSHVLMLHRTVPILRVSTGESHSVREF